MAGRLEAKERRKDEDSSEMRRYIVPSAILLLLCGVLLLTEPRSGFSVATVGMVRANPAAQDARERAFDFKYVVHVPELRAGDGRLRIWVPLPQSDAHQAISNLRISSRIPYRIYTQPQFGNRAAYFSLPSSRDMHPFDITLTFRALRREYKVAPPAADAPVPAFPPEVAQFLEPDRLIPIHGLIGELSREQTAGISEPLTRARKIYDYVIAHMHYDHEGNGWGRGDAIFACTQHHGNCTDFHSLFIGMARAAGIPARFEIGFPLPPRGSPPSNHGAALRDAANLQPERPVSISGYHCWAEFYISGTGWVPIDASEAWETPSKRDYFFGALDENRIRFSRGRDLRLNPPQSGPPVNYFVYPYAELNGKPFTALAHDFAIRDIVEGSPSKPR